VVLLTGQRPSDRIGGAATPGFASCACDCARPSTAVCGTTQLLARLREAADRDAVRKGLDRIESTTSRMTAMLDEMLDPAHVRSGQPLSLKRAPVDLVQLLCGLVAEQQASTAGHQIHVNTSCPKLVGDWNAARLRRVLENLIRNAVKYSPDGGLVEISRDREDQPR
jgi:signal transduction histidine kinase